MAARKSDLDIPSLSDNRLSIDQISPLPALTQDEVRGRAWAGSGSRWNYNSLRLVSALLVALAETTEVTTWPQRR
jgi:hypothetical protein